jgi:hypothetical protein
VIQKTKRVLFSREQQNERQKLELAVVCGGLSLQSVEDLKSHSYSALAKAANLLCLIPDLQG